MLLVCEHLMRKEQPKRHAALGSTHRLRVGAVGYAPLPAVGPLHRTFAPLAVRDIEPPLLPDMPA